MAALLSRQSNWILSLSLLCFVAVSLFVLMEPETNICVVLSSSLHPATIQVQITPARGEISVGESKFFLCEGKSDHVTQRGERDTSCVYSCI